MTAADRAIRRNRFDAFASFVEHLNRFAIPFTLGIVLCALLASRAQAQSVDTSSLRKARGELDSIKALVAPALKQYCATKAPAGYVKAACPIFARNVTAIDANLLSIAIPAPALPPVVPPPVVTPPPVDTAPTPAPVPVEPPSAVELPRVYLNTAVSNTPSTGRTLSVASGGNLQAAFDSAKAGDQVLIACATFRGNFTYGVPNAGISGGWVTVRSAGRLPAEGTRISPDSARAMCYPTLIGTGGINTLVSRPGANHWRFIGLTITVDSSVGTNQGTILVGDASAAQNTLASVPTDIIFDRVYVHGAANVDMRKCIALNSARTAVIDSYVSECHSTFDAQAITGTNGPGPLKIVNNYLEGAAEGIAWGGADPGIPGLVPADIEIRKNHIFKPLAWQGSQWIEKNIIESKNSTRVLVEGNVLENSWNAEQQGYSFALWSVNQDGRCTWCVTSHWTVRNNLMRTASAGVNLTSAWDKTTAGAHHISISNNVWTGYVEFSVLQMDSIPFTTFEHNTAFGGTAFNFAVQNKSPGLVIRNNLTGGYYGISAPWGGNSAAWVGVGGGVGSLWLNNVVQTEFGWDYPTFNQYAPKTMAEIGFVGAPGTLDGLALAASSPYKGKATDGTDVGADIAKIKAAIAGVVKP